MNRKFFQIRKIQIQIGRFMYSVYLCFVSFPIRKSYFRRDEINLKSEVRKSILDYIIMQKNFKEYPRKVKVYIEFSQFEDIFIRRTRVWLIQELCRITVVSPRQNKKRVLRLNMIRDSIRKYWRFRYIYMFNCVYFKIPAIMCGDIQKFKRRQKATGTVFSDSVCDVKWLCRQCIQLRIHFKS